MTPNLKPCLDECRFRKGHVLWCENHPGYSHNGPDPYYAKILVKENTRPQSGGNDEV